MKGGGKAWAIFKGLPEILPQLTIAEGCGQGFSGSRQVLTVLGVLRDSLTVCRIGSGAKFHHNERGLERFIGRCRSEEFDPTHMIKANCCRS